MRRFCAESNSWKTGLTNQFKSNWIRRQNEIWTKVAGYQKASFWMWFWFGPGW